jgi:hypothetical protein
MVNAYLIDCYQKHCRIKNGDSYDRLQLDALDREEAGRAERCARDEWSSIGGSH